MKTEINRLLECVPNISEGRDMGVIDALTDAIQKVPGVYLLHRDIGYDANRTVFTFAGNADAVGEAAFSLIKIASEKIDMRRHHGIHPRIGAADVVPFVPLAGADMQDAINMAHYVSTRVAYKLGIPVYAYEQAAFIPERKKLEYCRSGQYEGLAQKLQQAIWKPDFGSAVFNATSGLSIIGAREFLIAYNVTLNTGSVEHAKLIAAAIRESGPALMLQKFEQSGLQVKRLTAVKAIGWFVPEYKKAQVSMNLTNIHETSMHQAFEVVKDLAAQLGISVSGSEVIGLVPYMAIEKAGQYYAPICKKPVNTDEDKIQLAIESLGLNDVQPFVATEKIIELRMKSNV